MVDATEACDVEVAGTWTNNPDAWDGDDADAASTSTASAQTSGEVGGTPFASIDDGDTVLGIEVIITCDGDGNDTLIVEIYKETDTGYVVQTDTVTPPSSKGDVIAGGAADTWGEVWSVPNDIKQANFGVRLTYENVTKANPINVYDVDIRVTHETPAPVTHQYMEQII